MDLDQIDISAFTSLQKLVLSYYRGSNSYDLNRIGPFMMHIVEMQHLAKITFGFRARTATILEEVAWDQVQLALTKLPSLSNVQITLWRDDSSVSFEDVIELFDGIRARLPDIDQRGIIVLA